MSKELIERLRVFAGDPVLGGVIEEAADLIEELERDLLNLVCRIHRDGGHYIAKYGEAKAIADTDTVAAQNNADLDALQADNARLRETFQGIVDADWRKWEELATPDEFVRWAKSRANHMLYATPEQSLAAYRNKVIEDCAKRAEAYAYMSQNFNALAEELRAMKEQP